MLAYGKGLLKEVTSAREILAKLCGMTESRET
jgi:hypothetical protein